MASLLPSIEPCNNHLTSFLAPVRNPFSRGLSMASLPSVVPCNNHHTSRLFPLRNPFSIHPSRALIVASSHLTGTASSGRSWGGWRWPSSIQTAVRARAPLATTDNSSGIGITEFYSGKNILVTGRTGFLGKALLEKILRTNPDIGKIYVMMKAKDTQAALKRLQNEVLDTELFKLLQEIHGKDYQAFVASKLVPLVGNVRESGAGIDEKLASEIAEEVDIIVHMAASTTFDERYDVSIDTNTLGPLRMITLAHRFKRLKLFSHVSTAYVNCQRQGLVPEEPLYMGDTTTSWSGSSISGFSEHKNDVLDIEAEVKLAFDSRRQSENSSSLHKEMVDLGIQRAKLHGWHDTYTFTKAMGEMVINDMRGEIPVVTIRPSAIESTLKEPFPGWIQGNRMMDPNILYYGKGKMKCFLADPYCVMDVVPVDMVVNIMIAAMAKHGAGKGTVSGDHVYHATSSTANPMLIGDQLRFMYQHFSRSPLFDLAGRPIPVQPASTVGSVEEFVRSMQSNTTLLPEGRSTEGTSSPSSRRAHSRLRKAMEEHMIRLSGVYEAYTFCQGRFDSTNTEALFAEMLAQERARFNFDLRSIDWMDYITNVHIPGLRKHVLKERHHAAEASQ